MVRVFLKGGVWKNSEDEILKAAVQKYGKQQWARVASLLNRKSAKQCKARWHEWLDPSVKKVEWSRQDEEKLLHLAKLFPAQWKTIGPLVGGRTASQCQEHYEKLLDQAAAAAGGGEENSNDDARQSVLRPGQIDPHPETKPARPDPIDMDEDEMEMLQEARARLANTQGKKAKRKAREKLLQQAKRLSELQKRRELKQAGLLSQAARTKAKRQRRGEIDLGVEIPFHKQAPAGFHDTSNEDARAEALKRKRHAAVDYQKVNESQYRTRDREAAQAKKREEARLRALERSNMQYVVAKVSETNDPSASMKRGPLELPAPAVADSEWQRLAKTQQEESDQLQANAIITAGDNAATQALLGDYTDRPLPTPMRTPMTTASRATEASILREATHLRKLERGQTPLLGVHGQGGEQEDEDDEMDKKIPAIDNSAKDTPARSVAGNQTPLHPRDELGLNQRPHSLLRGADDNMSVGASTFATSAASMSIREMAREERRAAKRARLELEQALAALPAPQFEYELDVPADMLKDETPENSASSITTVSSLQDAADVKAAEQARRKEESKRLYEKRSTVIKRAELPRPSIVTASKEASTDDKKTAEELIHKEMTLLLQHDAHAFPIMPSEEPEGGKKKKKRKKQHQPSTVAVTLDELPDDTLATARTLIDQECHSLVQGKIATVLQQGKATNESDAMDFLTHENFKASAQNAEDQCYSQKDDTHSWSSPSSIAGLQLEFQTLRQAASAQRKKNEKAESKLVIVNGGYIKRAKAMGHDIHSTFAQLCNAQIEESVFADTLEKLEVHGSKRRIETLQDEIKKLQRDEALAQEQYGQLVLEKKRLQVQAQKGSSSS